MMFRNHFTYLLLLLISIFATKSFSFDLKKVEDGIYVHFGLQEDTNKINKGSINVVIRSTKAFTCL